MLTRRSVARGLAASAFGLTVIGRASAQQVPADYPADYARIIEAARREGRVVVYSPTDAAQARPLQQAFQQAHPGITVDWNDLNTNVAYNRVVSEAAAGQMGADFVWSPAMDLQLNLVREGIAGEYQSPEASHLPDWAKYRGAAYGTTVEAAVTIYNKRLMPNDAIPTTRAQLIEILNSRREPLAGKVCTFDPEKSGTGFMWSTAEFRHNADSFWTFARALGGVRAQLYSSSGQMREKVVSGEHWLAINMFNSYAEEWARRSSNIGVVWQTDFTPAISRVALVPRQAPRPNAGRLFLDFLLSVRGQTAMARGGLASIRTDVADVPNITSINRNASGSLRPIEMNDTLLELLDAGRRSAFLGEWKRLLQG